MDTSNDIRQVLSVISYSSNDDNFLLYFLIDNLGLSMVPYDSYRKSTVYNFDLIMDFILDDENWIYKRTDLSKFLDRYTEYKAHLLIIKGI